jgi:drug/metabolite transporter (DMT)-like permease
VWGSVFLIPVALLEASSYSQMQINLSAILNVLFLAIFPSYIAYLLWNISIQRIGIKITSNFVLLNPVFSIALGVIFLHEPFSINLVLSTIAILAGAYFSSVSSSGNHY